MSLGSESNRVKQPYEGGLSIVPTSVSTSFTAAESPGGQYWKAKPGNARLQSSSKILAVAKHLLKLTPIEHYYRIATSCDPIVMLYGGQLLSFTVMVGRG